MVRGRKATVAWFGLMAGLACIGRWQAYDARAGRCALDGSRIVPVHQVDLVTERGIARSFCSIRCAADWPDVPPGARMQVRDEVTGEVLDAGLAFFVESGVVAVAARNDRTHAFRRMADAMEHVTRYGGSPVPNPFEREESR